MEQRRHYSEEKSKLIHNRIKWVFPPSSRYIRKEAGVGGGYAFVPAPSI
jgi:hypothetical protein